MINKENESAAQPFLGGGVGRKSTPEKSALDCATSPKNNDLSVDTIDMGARAMLRRNGIKENTKLIVQSLADFQPKNAVEGPCCIIGLRRVVRSCV